MQQILSWKGTQREENKKTDKSHEAAFVYRERAKMQAGVQLAALTSLALVWLLWLFLLKKKTSAKLITRRFLLFF